MGTFSSFGGFFFFLRAVPTAYESPRLRVESELQMQAYTTASATWDLSHICDLHYRSPQHPLLNPLSEARDQTCILMDTSRIHFHCTTTGTPGFLILDPVLHSNSLEEKRAAPQLMLTPDPHLQI